MGKELSDRISSLAADIRRGSEGAEAPFVVAIDGRSGVGKSTLAAALERHLDASVLAGDDFYAGGITPRNEAPEILAEKCIDHHDLARVLDGLKATGKAEFVAFDWTAFDGSKRSQPTIIHAKPIVLVEGVYAARPQLRHLVDCAILVKLPEALRMERLRAREGELTAWELQWHRAEDWYFENVVGEEDFDIVFARDD